MSGERFLEEVIEFGGVAGRLAWQLQGGVQFVAYGTSGGTGVEGDTADVFAGFDAEAAGDGDGLAEAGTALETHHRAGVDGIGEVLPGREQRAGSDQAGTGQDVYSSAGGRRVMGRPAGPGLKRGVPGGL